MPISPMMLQYLKIKEQYKDTLLLFRLGDFYEMFYEDALTASRELDLTLTGRDCGLEERAPMCGVPFHAVDTYIPKLIEKGYKVAICEQTTVPGATKGIVQREVIRVVTPGTVIDSGMLSDDKNNYLASVYYHDGVVGVSWSDISTGELNHMVIDCQISVKLNDLLSRIEPSEIICNGEMLAESLNLSVVKYGGVCPFSAYDETAYEYENALKVVEEQLSKEAFALIKDKRACVCSAGALICYIRQTQKRALSHIRVCDVENDDNYMIIDANARRTLELVETFGEGKKKGSLLWLMDKTSTSMGARLLRKWIEQPSINSETINLRLDGVEELYSNQQSRDRLTECLKEVHDVERLAGRLSYGNISPRDCISLGQSLGAIPALKEICSSLGAEIFARLKEGMKDFAPLVQLIFGAIKEQPSSFVRDGGVIKEGYDAELDDYRNIGKNAKTILAKLEQRERQETGIKNLKIGYNKVFGYYIEVLKSQLDAVPYRYIRKQTVAGGERFITQELKDLETRILGAEESAITREAVLYDDVIKKMCVYIDDILATAKNIAYIDCLASNAAVAREHDYVKPLINESVGCIKITEGRHAVVESLVKDETFVPNDTYLNDGDSKIMLITGPNMAGKSVYMRQVALITLMAHMGSFVPAKSAEIAITDRIFTRVGASDDLSTGRSTFMVEMTEVSSILDSATDRSLILLDEIGRGTSTYDGLSIAWAIMEFISKNLKAKTLFSTHYHELTELEDVLEGVKNYKLTVKEFQDTIIFLRKVLRGSANRSFGIEVASLAGLPQGVVDRAKELLKQLETADIGRQAKMNGSQQISIFNHSSANEICAILRDLDVDNISPRYALDILTDLKEKVTRS